MNIDIKDIITIDKNKKYTVTSKAIYNDKTYYCLCNNDNLDDILICYYDNGELVDELDKEVINKLLPLFYKNTLDILNN